MKTSPAETAANAIIDDSWIELRRHTAARLALGRSGASLPTRAVLAFDLAHAQARDAVHLPLDVDALTAALSAQDWPLLVVRSRASERSAYLARPDWGRRLAAESATRLSEAVGSNGADIAIVVGDGLSSTAVQAHAAPLLRALRPLLSGFSLAPIVIARQARVALADEVAELFGARLAICIIGERPGLSAADSLGAYLTYAPKVGRNDGERNCISNIRPAGLALEDAAQQIAALARAALSKQLSGIALRFDPNLPAPAVVAMTQDP
ncbi:MAG: eutC [Nevskia sp.]|nr:eutC [Nevskia sp.]